MKKNNGFTLVEVLAVIIILAIVLIIAVPGVLSIINKTKNSAYDHQLDMVKEAARLYLTGNPDKVEWAQEDQTTVTYVFQTKLQEEGYLDKNIVDPRDKKELQNLIVKITRNQDNNLSYQVIDPTFDQYIKNGLKLHLDSEKNNGTTHQNVSTWQDLSINQNHALIDPSNTWQDQALKLNGTGGIVTQDIVNMEDSYQLTVSIYLENIIKPVDPAHHLEIVIEGTDNFNLGKISYLISYGNEWSDPDNPMTLHFATSNHIETDGNVSKHLGYVSRHPKQALTEKDKVITMVINRETTELESYMKVYINGQQIELQTESTPKGSIHNKMEQVPFISDKVYIGARNNTLYPLNGTIKNVKVYNRALTKEEVQVNYTIDKNRLERANE